MHLTLVFPANEVQKTETMNQKTVIVIILLVTVLCGMALYRILIVLWIGGIVRFLEERRARVEADAATAATAAATVNEDGTGTGTENC